MTNDNYTLAAFLQINGAFNIVRVEVIVDAKREKLQKNETPYSILHYLRLVFADGVRLLTATICYF